MDVLLACLAFINLGSFLAFMLSFLENYIPEWMHFFFEWGKTNPVRKYSSWTQVFHVPNSGCEGSLWFCYVLLWFTHFYVVGSSMSCLLLWMLILHCFHENTLTWKDVSQTLGLRFTPRIDCLTVLISVFLLVVQTCRRLFECLFISVFSGRIHILHYLVGVTFYILDVTAVAVPFLRAEEIDKDWCSSCRLPLKTFTWYQWLAVAVFLWASRHQWNCHNILAELRHSSSGETTKVYRIPYGDWFEFVSSPHYLAEIMIYLSLFLLQKGQNIYIGLILLFTIQNMLLGASVTHEWYKNKFKDYPKSRYRIIPLLY